MVEKQKTRFKLLPYQMLARRWMLPAILLIPAGFALRWCVPRFPQLNPASADLGWLISIVGVLLAVYTLLAHQSYVSFHKDHFVIHPPFHPMAVSYNRIKLVHPIEFNLLFPQQKAKNSQYRLYDKIWGKTVPVVMLDGFPLPRWWVKLWFHPFLFHPNENGILLVVDDWM
ncbi:MAG: hypothetical protein E4H27_01885, partial [Anaerolineales bacterium]